MIIISNYCKRNLVHYILYYYRQNGRFPTRDDFNRNCRYPSARVYDYVFDDYRSFEKIIQKLQDPYLAFYQKYMQDIDSIE